MRRLSTALMVALFFVSIVSPSPYVSPNGSQNIVNPGSQRSDFRYIIIKNRLLRDGRLVFVMLDEESFSVATLKALFSLFSRRFPQPDELHVAVLCSLDQLLAPEEEDHEGSSFSDLETRKSDPSKHPSAVYMRWKGNESFSFAINGIENTVILKGKDLLHPKR